MTTIHKPTGAEKRIIRECAQRSAGMKRVKLEPGERYNTETDRGRSINIALVSDQPDWADTDLNTTKPWSAFANGFPLADGGRAIVDFYVYDLVDAEPGDHGDLQTNVVAYFEDARLARVEGVLDGIMWTNDPADQRVHDIKSGKIKEGPRLLARLLPKVG